MSAVSAMEHPQVETPQADPFAVIDFSTMLLCVARIYETCSDKKEIKKRLLKLAKRGTRHVREFIQEDMLKSTDPEFIFHKAWARYNSMVVITKNLVEAGASGCVIYGDTIYPVFLTFDSKEARTWSVNNELAVMAEVRTVFSEKIKPPHNAAGNISLFQTSGFSGNEHYAWFPNK